MGKEEVTPPVPLRGAGREGISVLDLKSAATTPSAQVGTFPVSGEG